MLQAYKRTLDFSGRANRKEFWLYWLAYLIELLVAVALDSLLGTGFADDDLGARGPGLFYALVLLGNLVPGLSVSFRRLHDTDRSAWWLLISLLPLIGGIVLFIFYVLPGTAGRNSFGGQPGVREQNLSDTFS